MRPPPKVYVGVAAPDAGVAVGGRVTGIDLYRAHPSKLAAVSASAVKNLEAISRTIDKHNASCPFPAGEVRMNPYELERLGWEEIRGLPLVADPAIGTGRFRIVCSQEGSGQEVEEVEAIGVEA